MAGWLPMPMAGHQITGIHGSVRTGLTQHCLLEKDETKRTAMVE